MGSMEEGRENAVSNISQGCRYQQDALNRSSCRNAFMFFFVINLLRNDILYTIQHGVDYMSLYFKIINNFDGCFKSTEFSENMTPTLLLKFCKVINWTALLKVLS